MLQLVFKIPFAGDFPLKNLQDALSSAGFVLNRMDDWDKQVGFLPTGETGTVRFFDLTETLPPKDENSIEVNPPPHPYEVQGTAMSGPDAEQVAAVYTKCVNIIANVGGTYGRIIQPPGIEIPAITAQEIVLAPAQEQFEALVTEQVRQPHR